MRKLAGRLIWDHQRFPGDFIKRNMQRERERMKEWLRYKFRREKHSLNSALGRSICFRGVTYVYHINDITKPFLFILVNFCLK